MKALLRSLIASVAAATSLGIGSSVHAATVSTLAGSGSAGIADGSAGTATFLLPTGVAWAPNGDLYVADAAAQRIRVVHANGNVQTIAGSGKLSANRLWVEGGYADGPGSTARFNLPSSLAIGLHGNIYVADTYNHCIRQVTPSGHVSTFAGSAARLGDATGDRLSAGFMFPRAIVADRLGNLFVADPMTGVRRIGTDGFVTNVDLPLSAPFGIAVAPSGAPMLFVTNVVGLFVVELSSWQNPNVVRVSRFFGGPRRFLTPDELQPQPGIQLLAAEGERSIGYPFAIASLDAQGVVYTDLRTQTVRYLDTTYQETSVIGGQAIEDAANYGGGYSNGESTQSRFDSPMGIAARHDGTVAVADSGNKRIRIIRGIDRSEPLDPNAQILPTGNFTPNDYRIVYVGNSFVWSNAHTADSIGGQLQRRLNDDRALAASGKHARVVTVRMSSLFAPLQQYIATLAAARATDAVVLQLNSFFPAFTYDVPLGSKNLINEAEKWQPPMRSELRKINATLKNAGIALLIVSHPLGDEISLAEQPYATLQSPVIHAPPDGKLGGVFNATISSAGAPWLDMWSAFDADLGSSAHKPLFLSVDGHFTPHANDVIAAAVARKLEQMHPWSR
ncbi:MAG: hypothetical protein JO193_02980 [Candidatus Eremiobacteraeota bacterium]|nr:hypothetical protein [Candidatus Eremiobacteraeota bacterium]